MEYNVKISFLSFVFTLKCLGKLNIAQDQRSQGMSKVCLLQDYPFLWQSVGYTIKSPQKSITIY